MKRIDFFIGGYVSKCHDATFLLGDDDPLEALIDAAIATISTTVEITVGDVTMHMAAWQDPDHWEDDWKEKGYSPEDVPGLIQVTESV